VKVFYYCHSGVHASVVAAGIHLGLLPQNNKLNERLVLELPYFDDRQGWPAGTPFFIGEDEKGSQVYTLAVGNERFLAPKSIRHFLQLFQLSQEDVYLVDALKYTTALLKWGAYLSLDLNMKFIGRPLIMTAIRKSYPNYVQQVERLKVELGYLN